MESFEQLLDDYLDFEDYEFKEEDYEEEVEEKQVRTESPFTSEDAISMTKFVTAFLGYQMDCSNLYHSGLRELGLERAIGVDNNFANKNVEYVKRGFLLIVIDAKGNRGTYLNPVYIQKYLERDDVENIINTFNRLKEVEKKKAKLYYDKYMTAMVKHDEIERFIQVLREAHKEGKVRKLERRMKND